MDIDTSNEAPLSLIAIKGPYGDIIQVIRVMPEGYEKNITLYTEEWKYKAYHSVADVNSDDNEITDLVWFSKPMKFYEFVVENDIQEVFIETTEPNISAGDAVTVTIHKIDIQIDPVERIV